MTYGKWILKKVNGETTHFTLSELPEDWRQKVNPWLSTTGMVMVEVDGKPATLTPVKSSWGQNW